MKKNYCNAQLIIMFEDLKPFLRLDGEIKDVAKRNMIKILFATEEYRKIINKLDQKYSKRTARLIQSRFFLDYIKELEPYMYIEHELDLETVDKGEVIGKLSGLELWEADWMFRGNEEGDEYDDCQEID